MPPPTVTVVVVTHVSPIKAAVAWALDVPDDIAWRMYVEDASVSRIDIEPEGPVVRWFNRGRPASRLRAPKNASAASSHVGSAAPRRAAAQRNRSRHSSSVASRSQRRAQRGDVAGRDETPLASVLDEVGQVARAPSDGRARPAASASAKTVPYVSA